MTKPPCASDPDLWFGYSDDAEPGTKKARSYEAAAVEARLLCLRRCPLAQQRRCAQHAVDAEVEFGVWAGIKLPGNQYRKRAELELARHTLRRIAAGELTPRQLPDNAALLEQRQSDAPPPPAAPVFRLTPAGRDRVSAA